MFDDNKFLKGTSGEVFLNNIMLTEINKINTYLSGLPDWEVSEILKIIKAIIKLKSN